MDYLVKRIIDITHDDLHSLKNGALKVFENDISNYFEVKSRRSLLKEHSVVINPDEELAELLILSSPLVTIALR